MLDAITASQVAMLQDQLRLQSISQNVSNLQTPGYKREIVENTTFDDHLEANMTNAGEQLQHSTQMQQGTFVQSKLPGDLALAGEGYFEVQTDDGLFYTRRGDFHVNEEGVLSSPTGARLLGKGGVIHVDDNPFTINASGEVIVDNHIIEHINVVQFSSPEVLSNHGNGLYSSDEAPVSQSNTTHVLQGYLEQSNVQSIDEMMAMVKTSRHFEATQRVMRTANEMLSTAINSLGESNV